MHLIALLLAAGLSVSAQESADWLDLEGGGISTGPAQGTEGDFGGLRNASEVPQQGDSIQRLSRRADHSSWGAGHTVSLLILSAAEFSRRYPGHVVYVGAISNREGGYIRGHKSHQNGLDADVLFMGASRYTSVLDEQGRVTELFDKERNWEYWRMLTAQKIAREDRLIPVVNMILVSPPIKQALCDWTRENGMWDDPENLDLLKRLRPTEGHDAHFHLRLHCSPFHGDCRPARDSGRTAKTGCETETAEKAPRKPLVLGAIGFMVLYGLKRRGAFASKNLNV